MCAVMATRDEGTGLPIGDVLKRTRTRRKVDIQTVEQQTKIRTKYLRALENEEWDVLPGPAYAKGFLRTYAQFLGLDGDALVDEYRRTVETALHADHAYGFPEPVLERRRRPGGEPRSGWPARVWVIGALAAGAVALLVVLGLTDSTSDKAKPGHHNKGKHQAQQDGHGGGSNGGSGSKQPVTLALVTRNDMEVCLVTGDGRALIDAQTLISGANEGPFQPAADNYRLDLDSGGAVTLTLDGKQHTVRSRTPASYNISSDGIQSTSFKGPGCP
jgi:cytoskeleton protein RodZ